MPSSCLSDAAPLSSSCFPGCKFVVARIIQKSRDLAWRNLCLGVHAAVYSAGLLQSKIQGICLVNPCAKTRGLCRILVTIELQRMIS